MSVELIPRAKVVDHWTRPKRGQAALPTVDRDGPAPAVRVPLDPRPWWNRGSLGGVWVLIWLVPMAFRTWRQVWFVALGIVVVVVLLASRGVRLPRLTGRSDPTLLLRPDGIVVDALVVPWGQVDAVVRLRFGWGDGMHDFLAVRVRDFVGVQGLTPFRAGLANLTRRHLVVLADTTELRDPESLARGLDHLVAHPEDRRLLDSDVGARLVGGT